MRIGDPNRRKQYLMSDAYGSGCSDDKAYTLFGNLPCRRNITVCASVLRLPPCALQTVFPSIRLTGASARKDGQYEREEVHSGMQRNKG